MHIWFGLKPFLDTLRIIKQKHGKNIPTAVATLFYLLLKKQNRSHLNVLKY